MDCLPETIREKVAKALAEKDLFEKIPLFTAMPFEVDSLSGVRRREKNGWNDRIIYAKMTFPRQK